MARLKRGAKTQAVRDYISANPTVSPKEIVAGLASAGMKVKITLVRSIMYKKSSKRGRRRAPSVHAAARKTATTGVTIEQLLEVKRFADSFGGADQVRQALDTLEQLQ
jgi:hypothetical protein